MPANGRIRSGTAVRIPALAAVMLPAGPAAAQEPSAVESLAGRLGHLWHALTVIMSREETAALSLILGINIFAVVVAIMLVRTRRRLRAVEREGRETVADLTARIDRAEGLLAADTQVLVVWDVADGAPEIRCDPGTSKDLPGRRGDVLAFGKWLAPESAGELDGLVDRLRERGESFNVMLRAKAGGHVEADGRTAGGRAVLRFRDLAGQRRELAEIYERHKRLVRDVEAMRSLLDAVSLPVWLRDADGGLAWVNRAFIEATGAADKSAAIRAGGDLLDSGARAALAASDIRPDGAKAARVTTALAGDRRVLDVVEIATRQGGAGLAVDVTALVDSEAELARRDAAHARTLDQVAAGVAVFAADHRLAFHNAAFRDLWPLDADFLAARPTYGEILDRLRSERRLPEQADYRAWRARQLEALPVPANRAEASEEQARQELWHLPDGQILRVVRSVQDDGGIACLFEDVTQTLDLESRFVAMTRVQRETLDSLDEGIAVFASDGRLRLHNPAFAALWHLDSTALDDAPHVENVIGWCRALYADEPAWAALRAAVTSLSDSREARGARLERPDGSIIDLRIVPLPDGATLAVFTDISDSARIEKALRDRNEALMAAARIKNEFVHKVSYELRAPLTNIIGFAQLMSEDATGPLNERQREYAGYILGSSGALLAIINDILDLATIDAGVMELNIGEVDVQDAVAAAAEAIRDRVAEAGVTLDIDVEERIGIFEADEKRIRQILFNLLSNAVGFSEADQTVRLVGRRENGRVVFTVSDQGKGIPEDMRGSVFERFESHALGTRHRGVGLGLSIVKSFVELHGGTVTLESRPGRGTTVTVSLPPHPPRRGGAAGSDSETVVRLDAGEGDRDVRASRPDAP